jgi:hypothetical protein
MGKHDHSVKHLGDFYTVIVGLALTTAIYKLVDEKNGEILPFSWPTSLLFVAFLFTLLPFAHGALRHLDVAYASPATDQKPQKPLALLVDFIILFLECCLFVILAIEIPQPVTYAFMYLALLVFDVVWASLAYFAFPGPNEGRQEATWALVNFFAAVVMFAFLYSNRLIADLHAPIEPFAFPMMICVISIVRTVVDYVFSWRNDYYA